MDASSGEHVTWILKSNWGSCVVWVYLGNDTMMWILRDGRYGTRTARYNGVWLPDDLNNNSDWERI